GDDISGLAVHFHILSAEWPVPGGLDDALRLGVMEDNGSLVIHFGINVGLKLLEYRGYRRGSLPFHQPGQQIGTVAAEVNNRSATVSHRISQPIQKLLVDPDFHGPFMPI